MTQLPYCPLCDCSNGHSLSCVKITQDFIEHTQSESTQLMISSPQIRAAGTRTAKGVEAVARTIKRFMIHYDTDYHSACGMAMITCDEMWSEEELQAFSDAFKILFDNDTPPALT